VRGGLALGLALFDAARMTTAAAEDRFRELPERVRPEEFIESVDTAQRPPRDEDTEERERLLRSAGGF
jgi:hypothetical protein